MNRKERRAQEAAMRRLAVSDKSHLDNKMVAGVAQIRIGIIGDEYVLNLKTSGGEYTWQLAMAHKLAAGLRECSDGDQRPAVSEGYVWLVGMAGAHVAISDHRMATEDELRARNPGVDVLVVESPSHFLMKAPYAREMADRIEDALIELGGAA
jgi:hypothetical protein